MRQLPVCNANPILGALVYREGYTEVEEILGLRLKMEGDTPRPEYLVKWKDGSDSTWEPAINLSEDLVRDYEDKWWRAARKADLEVMAKMLGGGKQVLSIIVDDNSRSALHFAAALGNVDCVKLLVEAAADVNLQDREGYSPLHMAAGYMHTSAMVALLEAGADPQLKDNNGRDAVQLVDNLRQGMPLMASTVTRRIALEQVSGVLTDRVYEEVKPAQILNVRVKPTKKSDKPEEEEEEEGKEKEEEKTEPTTREFLVQFADGRDDEWISEQDMAPDVIEDFDAGLEYSAARSILDVVQLGTERRFKVSWGDEYPSSWEPEEHLPTDLIQLFQQQNPELFEERTTGAGPSREEVQAAWPLSAEMEYAGLAPGQDDGHEGGYKTQYAPMHVAIPATQVPQQVDARQAVTSGS